jgi:hypothetical protein
MDAGFVPSIKCEGTSSVFYLRTRSLHALWPGVLIGDYEVGKVSAPLAPMQPFSRPFFYSDLLQYPLIPIVDEFDKRLRYT